MSARSGNRPITPVLTADQEQVAHALCGEWQPGHDPEAAPICWEHCRPRIKGKTFCIEAAREVTGR